MNTSNSNVANIGGVILTGLAVVLAGYLSIRGMQIPDWLALFIGGGGAATATSISHTQGQKVAATLFASTQAQQQQNAPTTAPAPKVDMSTSSEGGTGING